MILLGRQGPWNPDGAPNGDRVIRDGEPERVLHAREKRVNLVLTRNMLRQLRVQLRELEESRKRAAHRNRQLAQIKGLIKGLLWPADARILEMLDRERTDLSRYKWRKSDLFTVHPEKIEARQGFWTPPIITLMAYLKRTTNATEKERSSMTAEILYRASSGAFPNGDVGARRAKKRDYDHIL